MGHLIDKGVTMIMTDNPTHLANYLKDKKLRK